MNLHYTPRKHEKLGQLLGRSSVMQQIFQQIKKAATVDIPILLQGETGTGKDLAAQLIHRISERSDGPYIPINLNALPSEMLASELFGHEKGSFTGAIAQHKGKFEQAKNGTIFLDEIESLDENVQVSLLRLIEEKKFFRLGGRRRIATNVRIIAASNANLNSLVEQGTFRQDLFYRLEIFPIQLPPLRQRKDDILLLTSIFVMHYNKLLKKRVTRVDQHCLQQLEKFDWPGNVRELKNVINRSVLLCDGDELRVEHLPERFHQDGPSRPIMCFYAGTPLDEIEETVIRQTLAYVNDNRTEAAKLLGISRRALYNRLRKFHIE